jgi:hypothetical protein
MGICSALATPQFGHVIVDSILGARWPAAGLTLMTQGYIL